MCKGICAVLSVTKAVSGSLFSVEKLRRITALKNGIYEVNYFQVWYSKPNNISWIRTFFLTVLKNHIVDNFPRIIR